jgi:HAMP domain-containing protein
MKNMSIKSLSLSILAFIAVYGAFVIYSAMTISRNTGEAEQFWVKYQDISSTRVSAFNSIVDAMGYGQMIHQFKDYVLRKDEDRLARIRVAVGKVHASIEQYTKASITPNERLALRSIKGVVDTYAKNLQDAQSMIEEGYSSRQIDRVVKIDDTPALKGLTTLRSAVDKHRLEQSGQLSKIELLGEFHRAMGFGGMIHQFKNFLLRQDSKRAKKVKKAIADIQVAIDKYRSFSLVPAENLALNSLMEVVDKYRNNLDLAIKMAAQHKAPEEIDLRVKIDDKPALSALHILHAEYSNAIEKSKRSTTSHLQNSTLLSRNIFLGSGIGLALLMLLISYVLFSHVLGPINKISSTLDQFIEGDLDIKFYGTERKDELGYMATVIDKLRLILISYALRKNGENSM